MQTVTQLFLGSHYQQIIMEAALQMSWDTELETSSPALTTGWICFAESLAQLLGRACKMSISLPPASFDS